MNKGLACTAVILLVSGILLISAPQDSVQPKPKETLEVQKIRVKTELMEVRAVVTDSKGRIVEDLKKEDFELLENDKPQDVSFFSISRVEGEQGRPAASETGRRDTPSKIHAAKEVKSQDGAVLRGPGERLSEAPVRTTLLYVDNLHLSFSSLNRVKQALRRFVKERLTPQDLISVATSSQSLGLAQQFTRDPDLLSYAIEQVRLGPRSRESVLPGIVAAGVIADRMDAVRMAVELMRQETHIECGCDTLRTLARNEALQSLSDESYSRRALVSTIEQYVETMKDLPGKRMMVIFSDGFTSYDNDSGLHNEQIQPAIDRAVRSGVVIYTIDAKGLQVSPLIDATKNRSRTDPDSYNRGSTDGMSERAAAAKKEKDDACKDAPYCPEDPKYCDPRCFIPDLGQWPAYVSSAEREEQNGLNSLADQTGGKMYTNHNDLDIPLGEAFDANRFYYVLSYYLPAGPEDHRFRSIKVRVRNHPEYSIRTARGFSIPDVAAILKAEAAKTPQQRLIQGMRSPLPLTDFGVSAQADFLEIAGDDKQVSLTVFFDGNKFQYQDRAQRKAVDLEIIYAVYDSSGKQVDGVSAQVEGSLTPERMKQAQTLGYRFSRRLTLKPGMYQARIGVREQGTDRMGTATAWVEVPNIASDRLEMSSLLLRNPLDAEPGAEGINVSELEQVKMVQNIPLYSRGDFCDYSFRLHRGSPSSAGSDLLLMKELLQGGKVVKQEPWRPIPKEDMDIDSKGWFDVDGDLDFGGFNPGIYELRISVKESQSNKTVQRSAVFTLE